METLADGFVVTGDLRLVIGTLDGRDPVELLLELVEALCALQQRGDDEQRPAIAHARERIGERRRRRARGAAVSHGIRAY